MERWYPEHKYGSSARRAVESGQTLDTKFHCHTTWTIHWNGRVCFRIQANPNSFSVLYFLFLLLNFTPRFTYVVHDNASPHFEITVQHVEQKLKKLNKKLFERMTFFSNLRPINLETFLKCKGCLYCDYTHCDGIHPLPLLAQLLAIGTPWYAYSYSPVVICVSKIFHVRRRQYCFLINLCQKQCFFVQQVQDGLWGNPTPVVFPGWHMLHDFPIAESLQSKCAFRLYARGENFPPEKMCGWINLALLEKFYLLLQLFDWKYHGSSILGLPCTTPYRQERVKGFKEYLQIKRGIFILEKDIKCCKAYAYLRGKLY